MSNRISSYLQQREAALIIAAVSVLLLLIVAPHRNGIYLPWAKSTATLCILAAGFICLLLHHAVSLRLPHRDGYVLLAMAFAYALPIFISCNIQEAIRGFLWITASLVVFLLAAWGGIKPWFHRIFMHVWIANSALISLLGLLVAGHIIHLPQSTDPTVVSGNFGYANAFAIYIVCASLLAFGEWEAGSKKSAPYLAVVIYMNSVCLIASSSKLCWLIFPVALIGYFITTRRHGWTPKIAILAVTSMGLFVGMRIDPLIGSKPPPCVFWNDFLLGLIAAVALGVGITFLPFILGKISGRARRMTEVIGALALILLFAGAPLLMKNTRMNIGPRDFSLEDRFNRRRAYVLRDAGELFLRSPLGRGGGSWRCQYPQFSSYGYVVNDPHSHIALLAVEGGLIALASYIALWILFLKRAIKKLRRGRDRGTIRWTALLWAMLALGVHSSVDMDLSFGALLFTQMAVFGLVAGGTETTSLLRGKKHRMAHSSLSGGLLVLTLIAASLGFSRHYSEEARRACDQRQDQRCLEKWRLAHRTAPFDARVLEQLARVELRLGEQSGNQWYTNEGMQNLRQAVSMESSNNGIRYFYVKKLIDLQYPTGVDELIEEIIAKRPWQIISYENAASLRLQLAELYTMQSNYDRARVEAQKILDLENSIARQRDRAPDGVPERENLPLTSEGLKEYLARAKSLLSASPQS
jgi:hypothetical protein